MIYLNVVSRNFVFNDFSNRLVKFLMIEGLGSCEPSRFNLKGNISLKQLGCREE